MMGFDSLFTWLCTVKEAKIYQRVSRATLLKNPSVILLPANGPLSPKSATLRLAELLTRKQPVKVPTATTATTPDEAVPQECIIRPSDFDPG
jgi:hypothetical protein